MKVPEHKEDQGEVASLKIAYFKGPRFEASKPTSCS